MFTKLIIANVCAISLQAQQMTPASPVPFSTPLHTSIVNVRVVPTENLVSLDQLVRAADLIVDGTVETVLPTVNLPTESTQPLLETQSIVSVASILFGSLPSGTSSISVTQTGGKWQDWAIESSDAPLVHARERYLLFLRLDCRDIPQNTSDIPHYAVAGVWSGLVKVLEQKIQFLASSSRELHESDGTDVATFLSLLKEKVIHLRQNVFTLNPNTPAGFKIGPGFDPYKQAHLGGTTSCPTK